MNGTTAIIDRLERGELGGGGAAVELSAPQGRIFIEMD